MALGYIFPPRHACSQGVPFPMLQRKWISLDKVALKHYTRIDKTQWRSQKSL